MLGINLARRHRGKTNMKFITVTMVRVYITESSRLLPPILNYLTKKAAIRGVSVFRAIRGIGESGEHTTDLIDFSLNLPLIVEFFDEPDKIDVAVEYLNTIIKPEHIVCWEAQANAP